MILAGNWKKIAKGPYVPIHTLGLILYAAHFSMQPCNTVFIDLAMASNPALKAGVEQVQLESFAEAACETSNPDMLWLLAKQESNFRFFIVRENKKVAKIHEGQDAVNLLAKLKHDPDSTRYQGIDIGVMQFNWRWHRKGFGDDPLTAVDPAAQVKYFLNKYSGEIFNRCANRWVGCYHNQGNSGLASRYQKSVGTRNKKFTMLVLQYLSDRRQALAQEGQVNLPYIEKDEFYRVFEISKSFPLPRKLQGKGWNSFAQE